MDGSWRGREMAGTGDERSPGGRPGSTAGGTPVLADRVAGAGHTSPSAERNQRRSPPPRRKEGAAAEGPRRKEEGRGRAGGKRKKVTENDAAKGTGGVRRSSVARGRAGVARRGADGTDSGAGAQHAMPPHEQQRHGVGERAWIPVVGWVGIPADAIKACTRNARSRTRAWRDRATFKGGDWAISWSPRRASWRTSPCPS